MASSIAPVLSAFEHELRARISGRGQSYVEELVAVGDRFVGAGGDAKAAELVRRRFRDWGLEVVDRPFTTLGYRQGQVELALDDGRRTFEVSPSVLLSADTRGRAARRACVRRRWRGGGL